MKQFFILGLSDIVICPTWFNNDQARGNVPDGLDPMREALSTPGTTEYNETTVEQETKEWMASGSMFKSERGHWVKFLAGQVAVHPDTIIYIVDGYPATLMSFAARDLSMLVDNMTQWSARMKPRETQLGVGREIPFTNSPVEVMQNFYTEAKNWNTPVNKGRPKIFYTHTPKYKNLRDIYIEAEKWCESEGYAFYDFHNDRLDTHFPEISSYIVSVEEHSRRQRMPQQQPRIAAPPSVPPNIQLT